MPRRPAVPLTPPQNHSAPLSFALLQHQSEAQPLSFHPLEHSFAEKGGCLPAAAGHQEPLVTRHAPLSPLESALTDELRVLPGLTRSSGSVTPLESTPTDPPPVSLLESALTEKWGVGASC